MSAAVSEVVSPATVPTIIRPKRIFKYSGMTFQDVDVSMTPAEVVSEYAKNYPYLEFVSIGEPEISKDGSEITYNLEQPPAKWKG